MIQRLLTGAPTRWALVLAIAAVTSIPASSAVKSKVVKPAKATKTTKTVKPAVNVVKPPTIDAIRAAWQKQNAVSLDCKYTFIFSLPSGVPNKNGKQNAPMVNGGMSDPKFARNYIRTPELLYQKTPFGLTGIFEEKFSERKGIDNLASIQFKMTFPDRKWRGGTKTDNPFGWWGGSMGTRPETIMYPLDPRKDDLKTSILYGWLKYGKVNSKQELYLGKKCWKVTITDTKDSSIKHLEVLLDPSIGYNPVMLTETGGNEKNGEWSRISEWSGYKEIAKGIWFPTKLLLTMNWKKGGIVNQRSEYEVIEISTGKKHTKAELELTFPADMKAPDPPAQPARMPNGSVPNTTDNKAPNNNTTDNKTVDK